MKTLVTYETADSYFYLVGDNLEAAKAQWAAQVKHGGGSYKLANRTVEASMVKLDVPYNEEHTHCLLLKKKK